MIRFFPTLRSRLILFALMALAPAWLVIACMALDYHREVENNVYRNVESMAQVLAASQQERFADSRLLLSTLAERGEIQSRAGDFCRAFREILRQNAYAYLDIGMVESSGRLLCSGRDQAETPVISGARIFRNSVDFPGVSIAAYGVDRHTGKPMAIATVPVTGMTQETHAALFIAVDMSWLANSNALSILPAGSILLMFNRDGLILQRLPNPENWIGLRFRDAPFLKAIMAGGRSGTLDKHALDGERRLIAYQALNSTGGDAYLVVGIPTRVAFAAMRSQFASLVTVLIFAMLLTLAILWQAGGRLITARLGLLANGMRDFGKGNTNARSGLPHADDEVGRLAHAFDNMADMVRHRDSQLDQYYMVVDQHAMVSRTDLAGAITFANEKFCAVSGYAQEELIGKDHRILNSGFHPREFFEEMWHTILHGKIWHGTIRNRSKAGDFYWVVSTIAPQLDENGLPISFISIRTDITTSLKIEQALQESERKFRLLAENSRDVVSLHDLDGRFLYVSPSVGTVLGFSPEYMIGKELYAWVHQQDLLQSQKAILQPVARKAATSTIFRMRRESGDYIWVDVVTAPVFGPDGRIMQLQSSMRNVTKRKQAEDGLRLRDKAIQANKSGILLVKAEDGYPVIYVNPALEGITGIDGEALVGRGVLALLSRAPDSGGAETLEYAMREERSAQSTLQYTRRDGTLRWLECAVAPVADDRKLISHFVISVRDVTERMLLMQELIVAKEASEQANRAKSEFLSRMTHELRTPLNFILGFAQLLEAQPEALNANQLDGVRRIIKAGWHLRGLIDEVLDLARIESGKLDVQIGAVRLAELLAECAALLELTAREKGISLIVMEGGESAHCVKADRMRIKQVMLNLLSNAIKFNHAGGCVTVSHESVAPGRIRISVADTGRGIDHRRLDELFQPFSRLDAEKAEIPGTGIGLAISKRFVELMEGEIGVTSVLNEGSTFWIELESIDVVMEEAPQQLGNEGYTPVT